MKENFPLTIISMCLLLFCFIGTAQTQNLDNLIVLIENVEAKVAMLDTKQQQDISNIKKELSGFDQSINLSDSGSTIEEIKSQITVLEKEFEQIPDLNKSLDSFQTKLALLEQEFVDVRNSVSQNNTDETEGNGTLTPIVPELRLLITELRETIETASVTGTPVAEKPKMETKIMKTGGRLMNDWAWMSADDDLKVAKGNLVDGTEFRRMRLFTSGTLYGNIDFKLQFDFAGGDADLKDAYIGLKGLPVYVKVGHFKEPFSLEELTSSKYITFMERALPNCFAPSRSTGFQISSSAFQKRVTWAAGVFGNTDGYGDGDTEGGYNVTARVTGLPLNMDNGEKLLHLGLSVSSQNHDSNVRYSQRPDIHLGTKYVDTGTIAADNVLLVNGEAATVYGPFSVQAEVFSTSVSSDTAGNPSFLGYYGQISYFLTGEHRVYKSGVFNRVKPKSNFGEGGLGAIELAVRYSGLDFMDGNISGGELSDITVGLNWHLNPNTRAMLNYIRADLNNVGAADILGMRMQIDF